VVEEQERIKDTQEFAAADRLKQVTVTKAEMSAQESLVKEVKAAEASKQAAALLADQVVIEAEAQRSAAEKQTISKKMLAEARQAEEAAPGLAEAQVLAARADSIEKHGTAEATVLERKAVAEAKGLEAKASATEKQGTAEAEVMRLKFTAEASGIESKAEAMKLFDGVGREHEEFKLRLNKDKDIEIAAIEAQRNIARDQSEIVSAALKSARIDIVGGETAFFDKIVDSIKAGKSVDRFITNSQVLTDVKETFFDGNGDPDYFRKQLKRFVSQFGMSFEDVKDLSVSALIGKLLLESTSEETTSELQRILRMVKGAGVADKRVASLGLGAAETADKK
jgi:hypothetical protein